MLLPKQQAQAKAWRLFIVSGSLTWFRRPRLASFTSTTIVETIHPLDTSQPIWLNSHSTGHCQKRVLAILLRIAHGARHVACGVTRQQRILTFGALDEVYQHVSGTLKSTWCTGLGCGHGASTPPRIVASRTARNRRLLESSMRSW